MNSFTECHPSTRCVTCPVALLSLKDQFNASGLIGSVMGLDELTPESSVEEVVGHVKEVADQQEVEAVAGVAIGAIAYRLSGRCPQFIKQNDGSVAVRVRQI